MASRLTVELRDRTKHCAVSVIKFNISVPKDREEPRVCGKHLLRSGTSVAAQFKEASCARSDQELVSKLGGALQETDKSQLWLELFRKECAASSELSKNIKNEASELIAIMATMINKTKSAH